MQDHEKEKELKKVRKGFDWVNMLFVFLANLLAKMNKKAIDSVKKNDE